MNCKGETRVLSYNKKATRGLVALPNLTRIKSNLSWIHDLPDSHLQMRGLVDGTVRFEKDDVINSKILPAYSKMLTNRGRYLELFNQHERAVVAFKEALTVDPNLAEAQKGLAQSEAKLRNP